MRGQHYRLKPPTPAILTCGEDPEHKTPMTIPKDRMATENHHASRNPDQLIAIETSLKHCEDCDVILARLNDSILGRDVHADVASALLARYGVPKDYSRETILKLMREPLLKPSYCELRRRDRRGRIA